MCTPCLAQLEGDCENGMRTSDVADSGVERLKHYLRKGMVCLEKYCHVEYPTELGRVTVANYKGRVVFPGYHGPRLLSGCHTMLDLFVLSIFALLGQ